MDIVKMAEALNPKVKGFLALPILVDLLDERSGARQWYTVRAATEEGGIGYYFKPTVGIVK